MGGDIKDIDVDKVDEADESLDYISNGWPWKKWEEIGDDVVSVPQ